MPTMYVFTGCIITTQNPHTHTHTHTHHHHHHHYYPQQQQHDSCVPEFKNKTIFYIVRYS